MTHNEQQQQTSHCNVGLGATNPGFSQCVAHSRAISVYVTVSLCLINNVSLVTVTQTGPAGQPLRLRAFLSEPGRGTAAEPGHLSCCIFTGCVSTERVERDVSNLCLSPWTPGPEPPLIHLFTF